MSVASDDRQRPGAACRSEGYRSAAARLLARLRWAVGAGCGDEIRRAGAELHAASTSAGDGHLARCGSALEEMGRRGMLSWAEAWVVRGEELLAEPTRATWPGSPPPP